MPITTPTLATCVPRRRPAASQPSSPRNFTSSFLLDQPSRVDALASSLNYGCRSRCCCVFKAGICMFMSSTASVVAHCQNLKTTTRNKWSARHSASPHSSRFAPHMNFNDCRPPRHHTSGALKFFCHRRTNIYFRL